ncbi:MAG: hypothetical protein KDA78_11795 [Planctomycetaceae bacterium]|nr:hypothetical protein [Planctomycetaceae bacterium]
MGGNPVANAEITFYPDNAKGTTGPASYGTTDTSGKFTLTGPGGANGAVIGSHKVTVICQGAVSSDSGSGGEAAPPCNVPTKYSDARESDLTADVKEGENNLTLEVPGK